jgi:hypothetical protein
MRFLVRTGRPLGTVEKEGYKGVDGFVIPKGEDACKSVTVLLNPEISDRPLDPCDPNSSASYFALNFNFIFHLYSEDLPNVIQRVSINGLRYAWSIT